MKLVDRIHHRGIPINEVMSVASDVWPRYRGGLQRYPSCLISCTQPGPEGGRSAWGRDAGLEGDGRRDEAQHAQ